MRVVADSQAILWYLTNPTKLSATAAEALDRSVLSEGIAIAAVTLIELWNATHKTGPSKVERGAYDLMKSEIQQGRWKIEVLALSHNTLPHYEVVPRDDLPDPFDRMIVATALEHDLSLVTSDKRIRDLDIIHTIW